MVRHLGRQEAVGHETYRLFDEAGGIGVMIDEAGIAVRQWFTGDVHLDTESDGLHRVGDVGCDILAAS